MKSIISSEIVFIFLINRTDKFGDTRFIFIQMILFSKIYPTILIPSKREALGSAIIFKSLRLVEKVQAILERC